MKYLNEDAATDYFFLSLEAFNLGFISKSQLLDRVQILKSLLETNTGIKNLIDRILNSCEWPTDFEWNDSSGIAEIKVEVASSEANKGEKSLIFHLLPNQNTGLIKWYFHKTDNDYFPSIPHGHWENQKQPKLDPYNGMVYEHSVQIKRVNRNQIVALWNDDEFRAFAKESIKYYIEHYPNFKWRVSNPLRLPRKHNRKK